MAISPNMPDRSTDRLKMLRKKLDQPTTVTGSNFAGARPGGMGPNATAERPMSGTTTPVGPGGKMGPTGSGVAGAAIEAGEKVGGTPPPPPPSTGQTPPPPPATATEAALAAEKTVDEMTEEFIRKMLGGSADTAEQEALIRELGLDAQGAALVNQRASMGRAGFASSGALGAMEGDIRRKQGQSDQNAILDLRRTEDQRSIDNAMAGIGADTALKKVASDEALQMKIFELMGGGGPQPGDIGSTQDSEGNERQTAESGQVTGGSLQEQEINRESAEAERDSYPDGEDAWRVAQKEGHKVATQYSVDNRGNFDGLPQHEPGPSAVTATRMLDGTVIYYDPKTKELFKGPAE